jgi:hypothetical protein
MEKAALKEMFQYGWQPEWLGVKLTCGWDSRWQQRISMDNREDETDSGW